MEKIDIFLLLVIIWLIFLLFLLFMQQNKNKEIYKEISNDTNLETSRYSEHNDYSEQDTKEGGRIESKKEIRQETNLEINKETDLKANLDSISNTELKIIKETDFKNSELNINQETNVESVIKIKEGTDLETEKKIDQETYIETDLKEIKKVDTETNLKMNQETDIETDQKASQNTIISTDLKINQDTDIITDQKESQNTIIDTDLKKKQETDIETNQKMNPETDKETNLRTNKLTDLITIKETELKINQETYKLTDLKMVKETDIETYLKISQDTNKLTDLKTMKETDIKTNKETDIETNIKIGQETNKLTDLKTIEETIKETDIKTNYFTNKMTDLEENKETDVKTNQETNKETDIETDEKTNQETNKETDIETDVKTNQETNKETDIETNTEIFLKCELNKMTIYFRNESLAYEEYKNGSSIYSSTLLPLSLRLECLDKGLNNADEAQIKIYNAYMHGNKMKPLNWEITTSPNLSEIYINLDDSNKYLIEQLSTRNYNFTFFVKDKDNEETIINLNVNHLDTSTNLNSPLHLSDWETIKDKDLVYFYANVKTQVGYYFNHDDEIRSLGDRGGFNPEHVMEIEIFDVYKNNTEIKRNESKIDKSWINFGKATPKKVFNSRNHSANISIEDFKYEIPLMYGDDPLINSDKNIINVTVYIGLKGDYNLDLTVTSSDASIILNSFAAGVNQYEINFTYEGHEIEYLASFLGDVTENEYGLNNWNKTERILDATTASIILQFYASKTASNNLSDDDTWNEVLGSKRYGE